MEIRKEDISGFSEDLFEGDSILATWVVTPCFIYHEIYFILSFEASAGEPESPVNYLAPLQMSLLECILDALAILRGRRLSPFDLILKILDDDNPQYSYHRMEFYKDSNQKLSKILDVILTNDAGKRKLQSWIQQPAVIDLVCNAVSGEMKHVQKADLLPGIAAITPNLIKTWTISAHHKLAPFLSQILSTAAQTMITKEKNKKKNPGVVRIDYYLCVTSLSELFESDLQRYLEAAELPTFGFPTLFGLFLQATGCVHETTDALHRCSLLVSYSSVLKTISHLASRCIELATEVGSRIHIFCYDNMNLSILIFMEQHSISTPSKVMSGTFAMLYKVCNGNPEHMKIGPIIKCFKEVKGLKFNQDLQPTIAQLQSFHFQLKVVVICVLTKYATGFELYSKDPAV